MNRATGLHAEELRIAATVRDARERKGWSQTRLAETMAKRGHPWHQSTIYRIEFGKQSIGLGEGVALCEILGLDLTAFAHGDPAPYQACLTCDDKPPARFTCNDCGRSGQ